MRRRRVGHWLLWLSDPLGSRRPLPAVRLKADEASLLIRCAEAHRVLPAVARNLRRAASRYGARRVIAGASSEAARDALGSRLLEAEAKLQRRKVLTVLIARQTDELAAGLAARGLRAVLLKGADFAARLYPAAGLRYYRDVDVLTEPSATRPAARLMEALGYAPVKPSFTRRHPEWQEYAWRRRDGQGALVEIHGDLVHSPALRRRTSVGLKDLDLEPAPVGSRLPSRPSPASLLVVAAVHAAISHTFGRLQPLCDVLQAARGAAGPVDVDRLARMAGRTGSGRAVATSLLLARAAFREARCTSLMAEMASRGMMRGQPGLAPPSVWLPLVSPSVVAWPHSPGQRLAREALRRLSAWV